MSFHPGFWGAAPFLHSLDVFAPFCICILQSQPVTSFGVSFTCLFLLPKEGRYQDLNSLDTFYNDTFLNKT